MLLKKLLEKRRELQAHLMAIVDKCDGENRAMTDKEQTDFEAVEKEIKAIDASIDAEKRARDLAIADNGNNDDNANDGSDEEKRAESEERAFEAYLRGDERRAEGDITLTDNGAVIPTTIANRIIEQVRDICPIYEFSEKFHVKGTLTFPIEDDAVHITMAYADEFKKLTGTKEHFTNRDWYNNVLDSAALKGKYPFWVARYPLLDTGVVKSNLSPESYAVAWQYSSKGKVSGISGNVDMDLAFTDIRNLMKADSSAVKPDKPTLRMGSEGIYVVMLQVGLHGAGLFEDDVTGVFWNATRDAVCKWQELCGLVPDGICGPKTWASFGV